VAESEVATRETALRALRAKKIDFFVDPEDPLYVTIMPLDETLSGPEYIPIPEELSTKLVRHLWWHYKIPIHWFWNPLMIPGDEEEKPPS
jgi:hypothetical protein